MSDHPSHREPAVNGLKMNLTTVEHSSQRYPTLGDYFVGDDGTIEFRVSRLGDWRYEGLVAIHEIVEYLLIRAAGIDIKDIDTFDISYPPGGEYEDDPGCDPASPYHLHHQFAEAVERLVCDRLGIDWNDYERRLSELS